VKSSTASLRSILSTLLIVGAGNCAPCGIASPPSGIGRLRPVATDSIWPPQAIGGYGQCQRNVVEPVNDYRCGRSTLPEYAIFIKWDQARSSANLLTCRTKLNRRLHIDKLFGIALIPALRHLQSWLILSSTLSGIWHYPTYEYYRDLGETLSISAAASSALKNSILRGAR
jgi:hypothetical protein